RLAGSDVEQPEVRAVPLLLVRPVQVCGILAIERERHAVPRLAEQALFGEQLFQCQFLGLLDRHGGLRLGRSERGQSGEEQSQEERGGRTSVQHDRSPCRVRSESAARGNRELVGMIIWKSTASSTEVDTT